MVAFYCFMITRGKFTFERVPDSKKAEVANELIASGAGDMLPEEYRAASGVQQA